MQEEKAHLIKTVAMVVLSLVDLIASLVEATEVNIRPALQKLTKITQNLTKSYDNFMDGNLLQEQLQAQVLFHFSSINKISPNDHEEQVINECNFFCAMCFKATLYYNIGTLSKRVTVFLKTIYEELSVLFNP